MQAAREQEREGSVSCRGPSPTSSPPNARRKLCTSAGSIYTYGCRSNIRATHLYSTPTHTCTTNQLAGTKGDCQRIPDGSQHRHTSTRAQSMTAIPQACISPRGHNVIKDIQRARPRAKRATLARLANMSCLSNTHRIRNITCDTSGQARGDAARRRNTASRHNQQRANTLSCTQSARSSSHCSAHMTKHAAAEPRTLARHGGDMQLSVWGGEMMQQALEKEQ